jgi:hypothetical protein
MHDAPTPSYTGMNPDDAALLARMQAGENAFEASARTYCGQRLLVARRSPRNEEDANNAVQDAFPSCFKGIGQFKWHVRPVHDLPRQLSEDHSARARRVFGPRCRHFLVTVRRHRHPTNEKRF